MSAFIALVLLLGAVWFLSTLMSGPSGRREPMDSVSDFTRAMRALDPAARPAPQPTPPTARTSTSVTTPAAPVTRR